jgi:transposase
MEGDMAIVRIGLDIAKLVFQVHGVDAHGKAVLKKMLSRSEMLTYFAKLPPCLIGIEACAGAHYWARELNRLGHDARLMAAQFVTPYRKSGKNDANDAEAICEAVGRPNMCFVPVKSEEAQAVLTLHRARELLVSERVALSNQIRGLLGELLDETIPQKQTEDEWSLIVAATDSTSPPPRSQSQRGLPAMRIIARLPNQRNRILQSSDVSK